MDKKFGKYVIHTELGRGAFGRVYRAFDPSMNRWVAIKVLESEPDPDLLSRFQAEAGTTANLTHEHIVTVYEFAHEGGFPYLVMQLLEGKTLQELIKDKAALTLLQKVDIMYQVAEGLAHAHQRGVIHRDIKPANIMVLPHGTAKIMDFGIARVMTKDGSRRTRKGDLLGTVLYMAPEHFQEHEADNKTDIFAYGVTFYELLTGEHPFQAKDVYTIMTRIINHEAPPLRDRMPECPESLEALVQRLMVKDREMRFDDMREVTLDAHQILQSLKQDRADALFREVHALVEACNVEAAQLIIRQVLDLWPLHADAVKKRKELRERANQERADMLKQQGLEHSSAFRYREAVACFETALQLHPGKPGIQALLQEAKAAIEKALRAAELVAEARLDRKDGNLSLAIEKIYQAIDLDSTNEEAVALEKLLSQEIRDKRVAVIITKAAALLCDSKFEEALDALSQAAGSDAHDTRITTLRDEVEKAREEADRQRRNALFNEKLAGARQVLALERLEEARALADALCSEFPEQSVAFELRTEVRERLAARHRQNEILKLTQQAQAAVDHKRFDEAKTALETGLRIYPRDVTLERMLQETLRAAAAHLRAEALKDLVEEIQILHVSGALEEALRHVDAGVLNFGKDPALLECERKLQLDIERREHAKSVEQALQISQELLENRQYAEAAKRLEQYTTRFPSDGRFATLLASAKDLWAREKERESIEETVARIAVLEGEQRYDDALEEIEAALKKHDGNSRLQVVAATLREERLLQERQHLRDEEIAAIQSAIREERWEAASGGLRTLEHDFPDYPSLEGLAAIISQGQRRTNLDHLTKRVEEAFRQDDLAQAEAILASNHDLVSEQAWESLHRELEGRLSYRGELLKAQEASAAQDYGLAKEILARLVDNAPDDRALRQLLAVRRAEEERQRRQEEEHARKEVEKAIARGLAEAMDMVRQGDFGKAAHSLEDLARRYPDSEEIRRQAKIVAREVAHRKLEDEERKKREAEEHARRAVEEFISGQLSEASQLRRNGDLAAAYALLEKVSKQYPHHSELKDRFEALGIELDLQRLEAERRAKHEASEQAWKRREQMIAEGRKEAAKLAQKGELTSAIGVLDKLVKRYPNSSEVRRDREAAMQELDYQRRVGKATVPSPDERSRKSWADRLRLRVAGSFGILNEMVKRNLK